MQDAGIHCKSTKERRYRAVNSFAAASEAARGGGTDFRRWLAVLVGRNRRSRSDDEGRREPSSASPIASIALRSFSRFCWNCEKSWLKAR